MYHAWAEGEPNGGKQEDCIAIILHLNGGIVDLSCKKREGFCGVCDVPTPPVFRIRGLCKKSKFDTQFSMTAMGLTEGLTEKIPSFVGIHNSFISLDDTQTYWKLENIKDKTAYATINVTDYNLLGIFGRQIWHFFNDTCTESSVMVGPMLYKREISLNSCDENMFNCGDGTW